MNGINAQHEGRMNMYGMHMVYAWRIHCIRMPNQLNLHSTRAGYAGSLHMEYVWSMHWPHSSLTEASQKARRSDVKDFVPYLIYTTYIQQSLYSLNSL